jgi:hypothetical protein
MASYPKLCNLTVKQPSEGGAACFSAMPHAIYFRGGLANGLARYYLLHARSRWARSNLRGSHMQTIRAWLARRVYLYRAKRTYAPAAYALCQMRPTGWYQVRH